MFCVKKGIIQVILLPIFITACVSLSIEPKATQTLLPIITATSTLMHSEKAALTPTHTPTPSIAPTRTLTSTIPKATMTSTAILSDSILDDLESQGYIQDDLIRFDLFSPNDGAMFFSNQGQFFGNISGGPQFNVENPPTQLYYHGLEDKVYTYMQYAAPDGNNCHLVFYISEGDTNQMIADVDVSQLNDRINNVITSPADTIFPTPMYCLPFDWGDINGNGLPDIPVTILWGNNYTGGEIHIFEVLENETVLDLSTNLPGAMSHWDFDPQYSGQMVVDLMWADHDCIYPQSPFSFWIFDWDGEKYSDYTDSGSYNFSHYINLLDELVTSRYGEPFNPRINIGPIVSILLMYDKMGQRDAGWEKYLDMVNMDNWPNTDAESLKWLQNDISHFTAQYDSGIPFSPNDYCDHTSFGP